MKEGEPPVSDDQPNRERFITIDDLLVKSQELYEGLRTLCDYKHPLDVRRGVNREGKGVDDLGDSDELSRTVKAGSKTYFLDIKETKDSKPYLLITESLFKGEGKDRERNSIVVFQENAKEFAEAFSEVIAKLD